MKALLLLLAIGVYLLSGMFPQVEFQGILSILCILIIMVYYLAMKPFVKILGGMFLGLGLLMLAKSGATWETYLFSFGKMMNILSLFALVPLVAIPIELGHYAVGVQRLIQKKVNRSGFLYVITSSLSYILSTFMGLATLPMMYYTIRPSVNLFPIKEKERFISRAITHGYSMPIVWTPIAPIVGIVVDMTGVSWNSILPILLVISMLGLGLDWFLGIRLASKRRKEADFPSDHEWENSRTEVAVSLEEQVEKVRSHHPLHIIWAILVLNGIIIMVDKVTSFEFLFIVTMVVLPFSLGWSLLLGKGKEFIKKSRTVLPNQLLKMKEQFVIFLSAGFFLSAMNQSDVGHLFNLWVMDVIHVVSPSVFILLIPMIPLGLAFTGLHPAVGLALVAESLNPQLLGISSEIIAIAMLTGAATAFLMGPYNATIGIMSNMMGENPYRVSNWNAPFTLAYLVLIMVVLTLLQLY